MAASEPSAGAGHDGERFDATEIRLTVRGGQPHQLAQCDGEHPGQGKPPKVASLAVVRGHGDRPQEHEAEAAEETARDGDDDGKPHGLAGDEQHAQLLG